MDKDEAKQDDDDPHPPPPPGHDDHGQQSSFNPMQQFLWQLQRRAMGLNAPVDIGQQQQQQSHQQTAPQQLQQSQPVIEQHGTGIVDHHHRQQHQQQQPTLSEERLQALHYLALQRQQPAAVTSLNPVQGQFLHNQERQQGNADTSFASALQRLQQHQPAQQQQLSLPEAAEQQLPAQSLSQTQASLIALHLQQQLQQSRGHNNAMASSFLPNATSAAPTSPGSAAAAAFNIEALLARSRMAASVNAAAAAAATAGMQNASVPRETAEAAAFNIEALLARSRMAASVNAAAATAGMQNVSVPRETKNNPSPLLMLELLRQLQSSSAPAAAAQQQQQQQQPLTGTGVDPSILAALLSSSDQNPSALLSQVGDGFQQQQPFASLLPVAESSQAQERRTAAGAGAADVVSKKKTSDQESFPEKLYRLLIEVESMGRDDVISFTANGEHFEIHQPEIFADEIIPEFYRHNKLSSFKRQLGLYGFKTFTEGPHTGEYHHPDFKRGNPDSVRRIKRRPRPGDG